MAEYLRPAIYNPASHGAMSYQQHETSSPRVRGQPQYSVAAKDEPTFSSSYYFSPRFATASTYMAEDISPDEPTPRANLFNKSMTLSQPSPRYPVQPSFDSASQSDSDFDSLYDVTDNESEAEVPLKCSASVKKTSVAGKSGRFPSILIPSPADWPSIEKLQSAMSSVPPTSAQILTPSRKALMMMNEMRLPSAAPSLDGSLTSEEMDKLSCPATPDMEKQHRQSYNSEDWEPMQLDFQALETLQHLGHSSDYAHETQTPQVIETPTGEMQEVSRPFLGLSIPESNDDESDELTPVSAISVLSVPSPGGFFSSLQSNARHTWSMAPAKDDATPNTSTAENFYQLPWEAQQAAAVNSNTALAGTTLDGFEESLPTPKPKLTLITEEVFEVKEIDPSETTFEYNETYHVELEKIANANIERTSHWLADQKELQAALRDITDLSSPSDSSVTHSRGGSIDQIVRKKSVKFAALPTKQQSDSESDDEEDDVLKTIETYIQGFEHIQGQSDAQDAFIHRQTRAEAMHVHRRCMPQAHRDQLLGKFELTDPVRPAPPRPVSEFYVNDPTALKERIARAQSERQALDQLLPRTWALQALKQLNNGKLLSKPAAKAVKRSAAPRILDIGGVAVNDWAWQVAYDFPQAAVTTVYTAGNNLTSNVSGPSNHKKMTVPNLWTLPFPSNTFDVVSARSLYELLKTDKPLGRSQDEYDLCIKECHRVLKTGGVLDFSLIDADIIHAGRQAQAMGIEFGFNLKTRGYDAAPTKSFLNRVCRAGFNDVQRTWMVLPMGQNAANWREVLPVGASDHALNTERSISPDGEVLVSGAPVNGTTNDAAMMTGIVGSWMYERWMLRLQTEMGREESRLLEGVVNVLEEGAKEGSGWRYLVGYARK